MVNGLFVLLFIHGASAAAVKSRLRSPALKDSAERPIALIRKNGESATLDRMQYWHPAGPPEPPTSRYLIFTHDAGGPNNLRIGWEMTAVVAQRTNRTLVLPPADKIYLLDFGPTNGRSFLLPDSFDKEGSKTKTEDLINLAQLKANLPTLTWDEFEKRTALTFAGATAKAGKVTAQGCPGFEEFEGVKDDILYMDGKDARQGFMCGEWAKLGGPSPNWRFTMQDENWALLTHGFVWHPDAFSIASKVVKYLGLFQYNALHGRYGDLQFQEVRTDPKQIFKNWPSLLQGVKTLYIASDNPEKFDALDYGGVRRLSWADLFTEKTGYVLNSEKAKYTPERWFKLMGPVEELICTYSKLFVGTRLSSFSGHIQRMRIHSQAPVKKVNVHSFAEVPGEILDTITLWNEQESHYQRLAPSIGDVFLEVNPLAEGM